MSLTSSELNALKSLSCFEEVLDVSMLVDGMSHTCSKVTTSSQSYFVKKLNNETAEEEVVSSLLAAKHRLSPKVIYYDETWLVTEYIDSIILDKAEFSIDKFITTSLTLMAKLHQLLPQLKTGAIPNLDTLKSVQRLFTNPVPLPSRQRLILADITDTLTSKIEAEQSFSGAVNVLCHGDINYSNIVFDKTQQPWLIDFECSHLAPVEFDLSMFIAVNNIPTHLVDDILTCYTDLVPNYRPNQTLITYYLLYSFFINGLWYLDNRNDSKGNNHLRSLAIEQWSAFDNFAVKHHLDIPKLMPLIS
jgi:thiamine kinase-like enzyme